MSLDAAQLRQMVIKPALEKLGLWPTAAEELVLGTAIVESSLVYIRQHGAGPALGLWQVEPTTHDDLYANYLSYRQELSSRLMDLQSPALSMGENLATNLMYDTAVCRLCYYRQPEALPEAGDIEGQAAFWKQHYNTPLGAGTVSKYTSPLSSELAG
jgi:hypothetical protein